MVRSVSSETADSESQQNPYRQVIYEFYPEKSVNRKVSVIKLHLRLVGFIQDSLEMNRKRLVNASDRLRTTQHMILSFTYKKFRGFMRANPNSNASDFFNDPKVSPLFPLMLKALFTQSPKHLCLNLKIRCCTSSNHFSFCKFKWRALQNFLAVYILCVVHPNTLRLSFLLN